MQRRAGSGAQLAADALLHPVGVAVEHVTSMEPLWLLDRHLVGILGGDHLAAEDRPQHRLRR
jgi:hypothetical protein